MPTILSSSPVLPAHSFFRDRIPDGKEEWLTPPELVGALGPFDLDPCSPINRPWSTAARHLTINDDGLNAPWTGRVWLNPPYGNKTGIWLNRLRDHGNGIALVFARTETKMFHESVFGHASALLWMRGRIRFYNVDGSKPSYMAGAPSVFIAYGEENALALRTSGIDGWITTA